MKILSRNKQDEVLKRLTAVLITLKACNLSEEFAVSLADNLMECADIVGGVDGMRKVCNSLKAYEVSRLFKRYKEVNYD